MSNEASTTRSDVLQQLSDQLRRKDMKIDVWIKTLTIYARLQGWLK